MLRVNALRIPFDDLRDTSSQVFVRFGSDIAFCSLSCLMRVHHVSRHVSQTWTTT